ncbi:MAG: hypothetical protein KVP17_001447 [Porospora cf. gigantea B]|uniref:uncharacterized protein n=1 Tax=Porospora cf. gigantea B TaxID=2853592 RepID=UPI003571C54A|nr:MAG: hypothetical protein KVP17_001447 [Porospora cf. gigantea B]
MSSPMISSSSGLSDLSGFVPFKATQDKWDHSTRREMQYLRTRLLALLRQHNLKQTYLSFFLRDETMTNLGPKKRLEFVTVLSNFFEQLDSGASSLDRLISIRDDRVKHRSSSKKAPPKNGLTSFDAVMTSLVTFKSVDAHCRDHQAAAQNAATSWRRRTQKETVGVQLGFPLRAEPRRGLQFGATRRAEAQSLFTSEAWDLQHDLWPHWLMKLMSDRSDVEIPAYESEKSPRMPPPIDYTDSPLAWEGVSDATMLMAPQCLTERDHFCRSPNAGLIPLCVPLVNVTLAGLRSRDEQRTGVDESVNGGLLSIYELRNLTAGNDAFCASHLLHLWLVVSSTDTEADVESVLNRLYGRVYMGSPDVVRDYCKAQFQESKLILDIFSSVLVLLYRSFTHIEGQQMDLKVEPGQPPDACLSAALASRVEDKVRTLCTRSIHICNDESAYGLGILSSPIALSWDIRLPDSELFIKITTLLNQRYPWHLATLFGHALMQVQNHRRHVTLTVHKGFSAIVQTGEKRIAETAARRAKPY